MKIMNTCRMLSLLSSALAALKGHNRTLRSPSLSAFIALLAVFSQTAQAQRPSATDLLAELINKSTWTMVLGNRSNPNPKINPAAATGGDMDDFMKQINDAVAAAPRGGLLILMAQNGEIRAMRMDQNDDALYQVKAYPFDGSKGIPFPTDLANLRSSQGIRLVCTPLESGPIAMDLWLAPRGSGFEGMWSDGRQTWGTCSLTVPVNYRPSPDQEKANRIRQKRLIDSFGAR